jgi:type III pantothenate kinase
MLLAIDSGNTNTVFAVFENNKCIGEWRAATDPKRTADEYGVWLTQLLQVQKIELQSINQAIIATVVPEALFSLLELCRKYFNDEPLVVGDPDVKLDIDVLVDDPAQVGADRLVNAVAGYQKHKEAFVVVDFGTATTFDLIDHQGAYRGGVIAPGINLSLEALDLAAARLPRITVKKPSVVVGRNTVSAMQSGIYWGYVGLLEGLIKRIHNEFGDTTKVLATGGLAPLFAEATAIINEIDLDMTMRGLNYISILNRGPC